MGSTTLKCPRCSGKVQIGDARLGVCPDCSAVVDSGGKQVFAEPLSEEQLERLKDVMFSSFESGDLVLAHEIARNIIALDSEDADVWYVNGMCTLDRSEYPMDSDSAHDAVAIFNRFTTLTGLEVDIDGGAFKRYLEAAKNGDPRAQHRVGTMYSRGMGVEQSQEKAMEWFKKAYESGYKDVRTEISDSIRWLDVDEYTVPSFIDEIWDGMFEETSFTTVTIPEPIRHIGNRAFAGCSNLETVNLPKTLKSIGDEAFYRCKSLKTIYVPRFVSIGKDAFLLSGIKDVRSAGRTKTEPKPPVKPSAVERPKTTPRPAATVKTTPRPTPTVKTTTPSKPSFTDRLKTVTKPGFKAPTRATWKNFFWMVRISTMVFPAVCIFIIFENFDSIFAIGLSVAPFLNLITRVTDHLTTYSFAINFILIVYGFFLGFAFSIFHTLVLICVADIVVTFVVQMIGDRYGLS